MIDVAGGNKIYYYHSDGLGSVAALSDLNGIIVERYALIKAGRMCAKYSHDTGTRKGSRPAALFRPILFLGGTISLLL
jgi:hypothetical protein